MRSTILATFLLICFIIPSRAQQIKDADSFQVRVVADRLSDPWEVAFGPDSALWVTESKGYRVLRISPADGSREVVADLSAERNFPRYDRIPDSVDGDKPWPQAGLMGMALHPGLLDGKPYVFLAYHYIFKGASQGGTGCLDREGGCFFSTRIVRYRYDVAAHKLVDPETVADELPGSNDHNGGRLLIAPIGGKEYLFYSIGDMGAGQFQNAGRPNHAQDPRIYEGKILRFNADPDTSFDHPHPDRWIPRDNPYGNAVFTLGHRNPQGLAVARINGDTILYSCEHGPFSDDEVNLLEKGSNYGHPLVIGYADGNYDGLAAGVTDHPYLPGEWQTSYPPIADEKLNAATIGAGYRDPIHSFFPETNKVLKQLLIKQKKGKRDEWKAEAPSSIEVYTGNAIPGWKNSLLVTTLKGGKLIRLPLDSTGRKINGKPVEYFKGPVRYRDLAISPDGTRIFVALDSTAVTSGPTEQNAKSIAWRGVILEYRFVNDVSKESSGHNGSQPANPAIAPEAEYKRKP